MFEPKTLWEKRAALNESYVDQLFQTVFGMTVKEPKTHQRMQDVYSRYQQQQQYLKDAHALNVLPKRDIEQVDIANWPFIEGILRLNLGRTFFISPVPGMVQKRDEVGAEHEGAIASSTFRVKYKDWLEELTDVDTVIGPNMEANFYADRSYREAVIPQIILPINGELLAVSFVGRLATQCLALEYMPADWNWDAHRRMARSEFHTYRGNITKVEFVQAFAAALQKQGQTDIYVGGLLTEQQLTDLAAAGVVLTVDVTQTAPAVDQGASALGMPVPTEGAANDDGVVTNGFAQVEGESAAVEVTVDGTNAVEEIEVASAQEGTRE